MASPEAFRAPEPKSEKPKKRSLRQQEQADFMAGQHLLKEELDRRYAKKKPVTPEAIPPAKVIPIESARKESDTVVQPFVPDVDADLGDIVPERKTEIRHERSEETAPDTVAAMPAPERKVEAHLGDEIPEAPAAEFPGEDLPEQTIEDADVIEMADTEEAVAAHAEEPPIVQAAERAEAETQAQLAEVRERLASEEAPAMPDVESGEEREKLEAHLRSYFQDAERRMIRAVREDVRGDEKKGHEILDELKRGRGELASEQGLDGELKRRVQLSKQLMKQMTDDDRAEARRRFTWLYDEAVRIAERGLAQRPHGAKAEKAAEKPAEKTPEIKIDAAREQLEDKLASFFKRAPKRLPGEIREQIGKLGREKSAGFVEHLKQVRDAIMTADPSILIETIKGDVGLTDDEASLLNDYDLEKSRKLLHEMYLHGVEIADADIAKRIAASEAVPAPATEPAPAAEPTPAKAGAQKETHEKPEAFFIAAPDAIADRYLAAAAEPAKRKALLKKMKPSKMSAKDFLKDLTELGFMTPDEAKGLLDRTQDTVALLDRVRSAINERLKETGA